MLSSLRKIFRSTFAVIQVAFLFLLLGCTGERGTTSVPVNSSEIVPITNMVLIKAGTFMRGKYPVTITRDFWLSKYELTQGEYLALMNKNPSHFPGDTNRPV